MRLQSVQVRNFRRLKDVSIDLEDKTTVFVGANNSGKTSATQIFRCFFDNNSHSFTLYDFSAACWDVMDQAGQGVIEAELLPKIDLDLWFQVEDDDLHRIVSVLPSLEWEEEPIGLRLEFSPRDAQDLLGRYQALKKEQDEVQSSGDENYKPWPKTLSDYLRKELSREYTIRYYILEYDKVVNERLPEDYQPIPLGDSVESGASILRSLLRVDFLDAQRFLADAESRGRSQDLSRRLSSFYKRNFEQLPLDSNARQALAQSEENLNEHLDKVFASTLGKLNELGYPGFAEPSLLVRSTLNSDRVVSHNTAVHYQLGAGTEGGDPRTLPDRYSGLGFKNLVYMVVELLDFHEQWATEETNRPVLHLMLIEEPEVHLHVQLQQVFIRKMYEVISNSDDKLAPQVIVTTHSPHIIDEKDQSIVRYFKKNINSPEQVDTTEVVNMSRVAEVAEDEEFLRRYLKLTHCDLFFADAAILVEGSVERLLLPLMVDKVATPLSARYLTILEVGGNFANKFAPLIHLLGIPMLVITDLDSVDPSHHRRSCMTGLPGAVTANGTLKSWIATDIQDLLAKDQEGKKVPALDGSTVEVCLAYQTREEIRYGDRSCQAAGRTFEEAFIFENFDWMDSQTTLKEMLPDETFDAESKIEEVMQKVHDAIKKDTFKKTDFALGVMTSDGTWTVPAYINEGLTWLHGRMSHEPIELAVQIETERHHDQEN